MKLKFENLLIGIILIIAGLVLTQFVFSFPYLLIFGFRPSDLSMMDYFPILPWFGIVLIGIFFGKTLYPGYKRSFNIVELSDNSIIKFISYLGRQSLVIYIIHQPILFCIIYLIF